MDRSELDRERAVREKDRNVQRELRKTEVARRDAQSAHALARCNDFALATVKAAAVTNAAGIAALLGFVSANSTKAIGFVDDFRTCMLLFVAGMIASGCATGLAYFSEGFNYRSLIDFDVVDEHPFVKDREPDRAGWWSRAFANSAILSVVASFALFIWGGWQFREFVSKVIFPALSG